MGGSHLLECENALVARVLPLLDDAVSPLELAELDEVLHLGADHLLVEQLLLAQGAADRRLLEAMAGDRLSDEDARANAAADEEAKRAEDPTSLLATELDGATHHFALSFAADRSEMATKLSASLSARGYTVRELPVV